jgi:pSer/pThr/pTyr-binding forkhead associated (FHA) protein
MTPKTQLATPAPEDIPWGYLLLENEHPIPLKSARVTVGRILAEAPGSKPDINLLDRAESGTVSRQHAQLEHRDSQYLLTDLKSTNHTFVNDRMLTPEAAVELQDGDTIQFGKLRTTFHTSL